MINFILGWTLRLVFILIAMLYGGLVLTSYAINGAGCPLRFDAEEPVRSMQQVLVWSGVRLLDLMLRTLSVFWKLLVEASADLGEWFVSKRSMKLQTKVRSHFL